MQRNEHLELGALNIKTGKTRRLFYREDFETDKIEWDSGNNKEEQEEKNGKQSSKERHEEESTSTERKTEGHRTKWTLKLTRKKRKGRKKSPRNRIHWKRSSWGTYYHDHRRQRILRGGGVL